MRLLHTGLSICVLMGATCAHERPSFIETIIDDDAPAHLWMKTTGDINGDGNTDMLVGGWQNGGMVAYIAPNWSKKLINDSVKISTDAEVCDINKDGIPDVVAVINQAVVWFGGPDFEIHHIDSIVGHDIEVDDFDSDGLLDVIVRNQGAFGDRGGHTLYFYQQKPKDHWVRHQREVADGEGLKKADLDGDGKQDIIINAYWYRNTGDMARWDENKFSDTWTWPNTYVDVADINGDTRPDIVLSPAELAKNYYRISWFEAPANPTTIWKEHIVADSIETVVHSIGAADFDRDGRRDIVIAEMQQGSDPDEVSIFYNQSNNAWEKDVISSGGCHSIRVFDADGDGDHDLFGANFAENVIRLWVNQKY